MKSRPILFSAPMVRALLAGAKTQTRRAVKIPPEIHEPDDNDATRIAWLPEHEGGPGFYGWMTDYPEEGSSSVRCPYGRPGDRLVVRETWQYYDWSEDGEPCIRFQADNATSWPSTPEEWADRLTDAWEILSRDENYSIDNRARDRRWRPSIHMPRWASRLTLEVTGVRVERLRDISESDAIAEGIESPLAEREERDRSICPTCGGTGLHLALGQNLGVTEVDCRECDTHAKRYRHLWETINGPGSWDANPWVWVVEFRRTDGNGESGDAS